MVMVHWSQCAIRSLSGDTWTLHHIGNFLWSSLLAYLVLSNSHIHISLGKCKLLLLHLSITFFLVTPVTLLKSLLQNKSIDICTPYESICYLITFSDLNKHAPHLFDDGLLLCKPAFLFCESDSIAYYEQLRLRVYVVVC